MTALPLLGGDEFWRAVKDDATDVEVMHVSADGDHRWKLNHQEKENLRNMTANGMFP